MEGLGAMSTYQNIIPSFDSNRVQLGKVLPLDTPFTVILDSSEACNFRCSYCFRSENDKKAWGYAADNQLMSWEIFEKAVSQIWQFPQNVKQISLSHHGEPLVNRNLPKMVQYIKEQGFDGKVSIHTNGSLLTSEYAEELAEANIDKIVISLQGLDSDAYKRVCEATVDFEELHQNLSYFFQIKKDTQINIKIVDAALKRGEEDKFYQLFSGIADRVFIETVAPIWKEKDFTDLQREDQLVFNKFGKGFSPQKICPVIFHTLVVLPNGDVYPCTQLLSTEKLGNIQDKTLVEMWNSEERRKLLKRQCQFCAPEICTDCGIRQNSIFSEEDMLDDYSADILKKL